MVGPGLTTFYFANGSPTNAPSVVTNFFDMVKNLVATGVTWTIPDGGDLIEESSGALTGTWSGDAGGTVNSNRAEQWAQGVGARIRWMTGAIRGGRRVAGTTFIVPLGSGAFQGASGLTEATRNTLQTAAEALVANADWNLLVWSRPRPGLNGQGVPVTMPEVPDAVAWLRSRKV